MPDEPHGPDPTDARVEAALIELKAAVGSRDVEKICGAYAVVRKRLAGSKVRDMFERVEQTLGPEARRILISSYSHRQCFMCDAGMVACDQCDGTGKLNDRICGSCDGLGIQLCTFCRGTGWADPSTIPGELARSVHEKQFRYVQGELARFKNEVHITPEAFAKADPDLRRKVGSWLMRLEARLADLEEQAKQANNLSNQTAFGQAVNEVDHLLQTLLRPTKL